MEQFDPTRFNLIDAGIIFLIVTSSWNQIRQGFVITVTQFLVGIVTILLAFRFNDPVAQYISSRFDLPQFAVGIVAFAVIAIVAQLALSLIVVRLMAGVQEGIRETPVLRQIDFFLSGLLGGIQGLIGAMILMLPFTVFPVVPSVTALIQESAIGSPASTVSRAAFNAFEPLLGRAFNTGMATMAPPQRDGSRTNLGFQVQDGLLPDDQLEMQMLQLINQERAKVGLQPLTFDTEMREVARAHSREMFQLGYFAHDSPVSGTPADRVQRAGVAYTTMGENLAYAPSLQVAHEGLMNSPGHRANILSPKFGRVGIGVIRSPSRGIMFTQNFRN